MFKAIALSRISSGGCSGYLLSDGITELQVSTPDIINGIKSNTLKVVNLQLYDNDTKLRFCRPNSSVADDEAFFQKLADVLRYNILDYQIHSMCLMKVKEIISRDSLTVKHRKLCNEILVIPKLVFNYCADTEYKLAGAIKLSKCIKYSQDTSRSPQFLGVRRTLTSMGLTQNRMDIAKLDKTPLEFRNLLTNISDTLNRSGSLSDDDKSSLITQLNILALVMYNYISFTIIGNVMYEQSMMKISSALIDRIQHGTNLNYTQLSINDNDREQLLKAKMALTDKKYRDKMAEINNKADEINAAIHSCNAELMSLFIPNNGEEILKQQSIGDRHEAFVELVNSWGDKVVELRGRVLNNFWEADEQKLKSIDNANKMLGECTDVASIVDNSMIQGVQQSAKSIIGLLVSKVCNNLSSDAINIISSFSNLSYGEMSVIDYYTKKILYCRIKNSKKRDQVIRIYTGNDKYIYGYFEAYMAFRYNNKVNSRVIKLKMEEDIKVEKPWLVAYAICCDNMSIYNPYLRENQDDVLFNTFYKCIKILMVGLNNYDSYFNYIVDYLINHGYSKVARYQFNYLDHMNKWPIDIEGMIIY